MFKIHRSFNLTTGNKGSTIAVFNDSPSHLAVLYHNTIVVERKGKTITLSNGGWDTVSTRYVINQALTEMGVNYRLWRHKGQTWLYEAGNDAFNSALWERLQPFESGMKLKLSKPADNVVEFKPRKRVRA